MGDRFTRSGLGLAAVLAAGVCRGDAADLTDAAFAAHAELAAPHAYAPNHHPDIATRTRRRRAVCVHPSQDDVTQATLAERPAKVDGSVVPLQADHTLRFTRAPRRPTSSRCVQTGDAGLRPAAARDRLPRRG